MLECKICNSRDTGLYIRLKDRELVECRRCRIIFDKDIDISQIDYYNEDEYEKYWRNIESYQKEVMDEYRGYARIIKGIKENGKVLEIGSGRGDLLNVLYESGYEVSGIELSARNTESARANYGLDVINRDVYEYNFQDTKYDIIILWGVIEHLKDLNRLRDIIDNIINKNGLLIISTQIEEWVLIRPFRMFNKLFPGLGSFFGDYIFDKEHLYFFYTDFLKRFFKKYNYEFIKEMKTETLFFRYFYRYHPLHVRLISRMVKSIDTISNSYRKKIFFFQKNDK